VVKNRKKKRNISCPHAGNGRFEAIFSSMHIVDSFVRNEIPVTAWVSVGVFYSFPLVFLSVFMPVSCCFYFYISTVLFEVTYCDSSSIASLAQNCLGRSRSFLLPYEC
jgi:hypothetical protein